MIFRLGAVDYRSGFGRGARGVRVCVTWSALISSPPLTLTVADAARVIGLSRSTISELARSGTTPSLRIGTRILVPVKALEQWIEDRLKEDSMRYAASWSRLRDYVAMPPSSGSPHRRIRR